ncbi:MAG: hypothetical protein JWM77_4094 [Rhodospirillales bacterium]|nr:hypothetical protein [Rhodospirillales bacterium]
MQLVAIDAALLAAYGAIDRALGPAVALALQLNTNDPALADAAQLEASLLDLALRARDAMPKGGLLKIVTGDRQLHEDPDLADGAYAEITLIAQGTDRPADLPGDDLVRRAGGTLRIEKNSAGGLVLRILLAGAGEEPDPIGDGAAARRLRILLVENDPDRFLEMSLRELGHEIVAASDAATALARLDGSFDLLVAACAMLTTAGPARRQEPELRMLFVTDDDEPGLEAIEHSAVLRLPFRKAELVQALAALDTR